MEIRISNSPLDVEAGDTAFVLDDQGSAMTTLILSVEGFPPIQHDEPHKGSLTKIRPRHHRPPAKSRPSACPAAPRSS